MGSAKQQYFPFSIIKSTELLTSNTQFRLPVYKTYIA